MLRSSVIAEACRSVHWRRQATTT